MPTQLELDLTDQLMTELETAAPEAFEEPEAPKADHDVIFAMVIKERDKMIAEVEEETLAAFTAGEWAGMISVYLMDFAGAIDPEEGQTPESLVIQRQLLLKAMTLANEALQRHIKNSGLPLIQRPKEAKIITR